MNTEGSPATLTPLLHYLEKHFPLEAKDRSLIAQRIPVRLFKKGEFLLQKGQVSTAFYFNLSGLVRLYYVRKGEEKTAYFYEEGVFISAYASFIRQVPATFYLEATEDTQVSVISLEVSEVLLRFDPKFEALARIAMEEEMISHQEIIASLLSLTPEERYLELLNKNPEIFQRVPQIHIASYIGVKPESLSRIKNRIYHKS